MLKKMKLGKLEILAGILAMAISAAPVKAIAANHQTCDKIVAEATFYVEVVDLFSVIKDDEIKLAYERYKEGSDYEGHLENVKISSYSINNSLRALNDLFEGNSCLDELPQEYIDLLRESERVNGPNDELYRGLLLLKDSKPS